MACSNAIVINEDNLCCSICLELFKSPRTLPCLHSFCHQCLSGYIKQLCENKATQGFNCPICRSFTIPNLAGARSDKWADCFPVNFTLVSILNSKTENMATITVLCEPCKREEHDVTAVVYCFDCDEKLCEDCKTYHKKSKMSYRHNVGDIKATEDLSKLERLKELVKCPNHPLEDVKFMCTDHDQLCCSDCAIVSHRKCEQMTSVAEMARKYKQEGKENAIKDKLKAVDFHASFLRTHEVKQRSKIDFSATKVETKLADVKKKFEKAYEETERKILKQSNDAHVGICKSITKQEKAVTNLQAGIVYSSELLELAFNYGNDAHVFIAGMKVESETKQHEQELRSLHESATSKDIEIVENASVDAIIKSLHQNLVIKTRTNVDIMPKCPGVRSAYKERLPTLKSEIKCERVKEVTSYVRGCVFIDNDHIIVTDGETRAVKMFDIRLQKLVCSYACNSQPWSIVNICDSQVAVGFRFEMQIVILKTEGLKMQCVQKIQTMANVYGLAFDIENKHMLALSGGNGRISLYQLDGSHVQSIPVNLSTVHVIQSAICIAFNNRSKVCYISSPAINMVVAIDLKGRVIFTYTHPTLDGPWVSALDSDDNLYVCCERSNSIHQLDSEGHFIRQILTSKDGLVNPLAMCFNKTMDSFVVTTKNAGKEIRVYDFT